MSSTKKLLIVSCTAVFVLLVLTAVQWLLQTFTKDLVQFLKEYGVTDTTIQHFQSHVLHPALSIILTTVILLVLVVLAYVIYVVVRTDV
ncbi:MAG: hypothetical protein ACXQS5_06725 [Candidatus Methanospirareceae archaeon]